MTYPNEALTDVCTTLISEYGLSLAEITKLATDLPGECEAIIGNHADAALLSALKLAASSAGFQYMMVETRHTIDAAIAKAEGRS